MATYYTLIVREPGSSRWTIQFGDYSREDVVEELREMRRDWPRGSQWKIVKSADSQASVDAAIKRLGQENSSTVAVLIWVRAEPVRDGRTVRLLCIDPEDAAVKKRLFKLYRIPATFLGDPLIVSAQGPTARFSRQVVEACGLSEHTEQTLWNYGAMVQRRLPLSRLKQLVEAA